MRIGFACKYVHPDQSLPKKNLQEVESAYNMRATTAAWMAKQTPAIQYNKIYGIVEHNLKATFKLVKYVSSLSELQRMLRIGSDVLPLYTHPQHSHHYKDRDIIQLIEHWLPKIGDTARSNAVRLSMHPGQFTVLASDRPDVVENSIAEFEYHADLVRWLGYGQTFQDFKVNVHISGKRGPAGIIDVLPRLSTEARNSITIENDEMTWGIDASLELAKHCALVLDIHHHYIHSAGEYIQPSDQRVQQLFESWRGVRPVIHFSQIREQYLTDKPVDSLPKYNELLTEGFKKTQLRAHSDYCYNRACNDWALGFLPHADIMVEAKAKNLASQQLSDQYRYANQVSQ